jgi:hypothetical protein
MYSITHLLFKLTHCSVLAIHLGSLTWKERISLGVSRIFVYIKTLSVYQTIGQRCPQHGSRMSLVRLVQYNFNNSQVLRTKYFISLPKFCIRCQILKPGPVSS